jgi:hypothetical protein
MVFGTSDGLADTINLNRAKFHNGKLRGFDLAGTQNQNAQMQDIRIKCKNVWAGLFLKT